MRGATQAAALFLNVVITRYWWYIGITVWAKMQAIGVTKEFTAVSSRTSMVLDIVKQA
jgi:hypothetical protein